MTTMLPGTIQTIRCVHRLPLPLDYVCKLTPHHCRLALERVLTKVFDGKLPYPRLQLLTNPPRAVCFETPPLTSDELALIEMELVGWLNANRKEA